MESFICDKSSREALELKICDGGGGGGEGSMELKWMVRQLSKMCEGPKVPKPQMWLCNSHFYFFLYQIFTDRCTQLGNRK